MKSAVNVFQVQTKTTRFAKSKLKGSALFIEKKNVRTIGIETAREGKAWGANKISIEEGK